MLLVDSETYLNKLGKFTTAIITIASIKIYIEALNQLNGLLIVNKAINPTTKIAIDDIVTSAEVDIPVLI